jgi:RNA polymerase sigma factor (sigma-70 family)
MPSPPAHDDDAALVRRCLDGDGAAWTLLVHRYERLVHAILRRAGLAEQDRADAFQTVFMKLLQHLSRISEPDRLQAWIVTTSKREVLTRRRRPERTVSLDMPADAEPGSAHDVDHAEEAPGPEETLAQWQRVMQVRLALERLGDPCRRLLTLLFESEVVDYQEVAGLLGMPVGSIGPTRARCLAKLRREFEQVDA